MNQMSKYVFIINEICNRIDGKKLGKKMLQKLMYLIERRGINLDLNYCIHFFGPYSSKLDNVMHILDSQDIIRINTSSMTHTISIANVSQEDISNLEPDEQDKIDFVLNNFCHRSALELEAITTIDYVANFILKSDITDHKIINEVIKIKGNKFSEDYLRKELDILKQNLYIN